MSVTGIVKHDMVKLPRGVHLPDGTRVLIVTVDGAPAVPSVPEALQRLAENPVDDPLTDGARRHGDEA